MAPTPLSSTPSSTLGDGPARERIVSALDESQLVEAAAGTGKTRILVERLLAVVGSGRGSLERSVVLTFTDKAAGELKLRIRSGLRRARVEAEVDSARRHAFDRALEALELAPIGTIHGFCADLLREYPVEAGVDPSFEVEGEAAAGRSLFEEVFVGWRRQLDLGRHEGLRRITTRAAWDEGGGQAGDWELLGAARSLAENRDLDAPWRLPAFALQAELQALLSQELLPAAELARGAVATGELDAGDVEALLALAPRLARAAERASWEQIEARLWNLRLKSPRYFRRRRAGALGEQAREALTNAALALERFKERSGAQLAALLQRELQGCLADYEQAKQARGQLDFMDLLLRTRQLLRSHAAVRAELQERFQHIFVDEFQDSDPLQIEILLLLAGEGGVADSLAAASTGEPLSASALASGKLFVVGDPKQSIYRFRRAEVGLYQQLRQRLCARGAAALELRSSFRAVPDLQRLVNAVFAPLMGGGGSELPYVPLEAVRPANAQLPAAIALPVPAPFGFNRRISRKRVREHEPEVVAAWIDWALSHSGWRVQHRGRQEPLAPHHICLLFRQLRGFEGDLTRPYAEALEARGISHVVVGGRNLSARSEVAAIATVLRAIEDPADVRRVYAVLRGPLFGFDDATLWRYQAAGGTLDPCAMASSRRGRAGAAPSGAAPSGAAPGGAPPISPGAEAAAAQHCDGERAAQASGEVVAALALLGALHHERNRRPPAETLARLYEQTRCLAAFALRANGEQALATLWRLSEQARRFHSAAPRSFRAFVSYLEQQLNERRAETDSPLVEEGSGGVRMMSVHRAKGLEFPIVLLADLATRSQRRPSRAVERERELFAASLCRCAPLELLERQAREAEQEAAEELRLLYVAATRASEALVVPTLPPDAHFESWLSPLAPAFAPRPRASGAPGLKVSGNASAAIAAASGGGPQAALLGEHSLWVWEPSTLGIERPVRAPLPDFELVRADGNAAPRSGQRYAEWLRGRARWESQLALGCREVVAATELAHRTPGIPPDLAARVAAVALVERDASCVLHERRSAEARAFGILVHALLEHAFDSTASTGLPPTDVPPAPSHSATALETLAAALTGDEALAAEALSRVRAALDQPLLRRAAAAERRWHELPMVWRAPGREASPIVDGVVDLVFQAQGRLTVVDYKTDYALAAEQLGAYRLQVALYAEALERRFGLPSEGRILLV